jgi:uncharacterized protein
MERKEILLNNNKDKELDLNIPLLLLQISGSDYENERVLSFIREYFAIDKNQFDQIVKTKKVYEPAITKKNLQKYKIPENEWDKYLEFKKISFRTITIVIQELKKQKIIGEKDIKSFSGSGLGEEEFDSHIEDTKKAIKEKYKIIIQGQMLDKDLFYRGLPDLLVLNKENFYDVYDIKRSNTPKAKFVLQICAYSDLLSSLQGKLPEKGFILLGNNEVQSFLIKDFYSYYTKTKNNFFKFHNNFNEDSVPIPKKKDLNGSYKELAQNLLKDSLDSVVNMDTNDVFSLKEQGINTKKELLEKNSIEDIPESVINRYKEQIKLKENFKILKQYKDEPGNLHHLSRFMINDAYIEIKKTETLDKKPFVCFYNVMTHNDKEELVCKHFYCSREADEEKVFNMFMSYLLENFIEKSEREFKGKLFCFDKYIYDTIIEVANKYASKVANIIISKVKYERFVYLKEYLVNSFVLNIDNYSPMEINDCLGLEIKNLDLGYETSLVTLTDRKGVFDYSSSKEVLILLKSLADSKINFYKKLHEWMITQAENNHLEEIPEENQIYFTKLKEDDEKREVKKLEREQDSLSRKETLENQNVQLEEMQTKKDSISSEDTKEYKVVNKEIQNISIEIAKKQKEELKEEFFEQFIEKSKEFDFKNEEYNKKTTEQKVGYLLKNLSEFHYRENSVQSLNLLKIHNLGLKELMNNSSCLTNLLMLRSNIEIERSKESIYLLCKFNTNEITKLKTGDSFAVVKFGLSGTIKSIDGDKIILRFSTSGNDEFKSKVLKLKKFHIMSSSFLNTSTIENNIRKIFIDHSSEDENFGIKNKALHDLILKKNPDIEGTDGDLYNPDSDDILNKTIETVLKMKKTSLIIQGPPGTGKSYTASKVIEQILTSKKNSKITISSNSNKAIDGLLITVKELLSKNEKTKNILVGKNCNKKSFSKDLEESGIECCDSKRKIKKQSIADIMNQSDESFVVGSTVFRSHELESDYLFVDEAGQVPLANILSMGSLADNIILIGDQNQLEQPVIGSHPGDSGISVLNYYLDINEDNKRDNNVVSSDKGFFLPISRRMNKELCHVVSKYFYKGKLKSIEDLGSNISTSIDLNGLYKNKGFQFIEVNHEGNTVYAPQEIKRIENIVKDLVDCNITVDGKTRKISKQDIIIVAPFNVQVDKMKKNEYLLDMNIGTVDKFQGQEAPIVIYSQTASEVSSSRGIDFILNPNRMNVALSRGKALAIMVGSERLLNASADKMEDLRLLNMFSELIDYKHQKSKK